MSEWGPLFDLPAACSRAAKDSFTAKEMSEVVQKVFGYIESCGPSGCTDEEGQTVTGIQGNTWRPCRLSLEHRHQVGHRDLSRATRSGRQATIWFSEEHALKFRKAP